MYLPSTADDFQTQDDQFFSFMCGNFMYPFNVSILDDSTVEGNQSFSLQLSASFNAEQVNLTVDPAILNVIIIDNDSKFVHFNCVIECCPPDTLQHLLEIFVHPCNY